MIVSMCLTQTQTVRLSGGRGSRRAHTSQGLLFACIVLASQVLEAQPFVPSRTAQCIAYSPTGTHIATGISGMANGEIPLRPHPTPRKCAELLIFNAESGERTRRIEWFGDLTDLQFSPDGKLIASARIYRTVDGLDFNGVCLWNIETGKVVRALERAHAFDFSPDGERIAVVSPRSCTVFDLQTEERVGRLKPLGGAIAIRYSPGGKKLIGIVRDNDGYHLRSCDVATGEEVTDAIALEEPFYSMSVSTDGKRIATGHDDGTVLLWNAASLEPLKRLRSGGSDRTRPVFSPDGKTIALCGQQKADVVFFDVETGREIRRMHHDKGEYSTLTRRSQEEDIRPEFDPARFTFSPDGKYFLAGCYGGVIRRMDTGNEVKRLTP